MSPDKEVTSIILPKAIKELLQEHADETKNSLNEVLTRQLSLSLPLSPPSLLVKLQKRPGGVDGAVASLVKKTKRGRPFNCKESEWSQLHDMARWMLKGYGTGKIASLLNKEKSEMEKKSTRSSVEWFQKRYAEDLEQLQQQILKEKAPRNEEAQTFLNEAMAIRAALAAQSITPEEYNAQMKDLGERQIAAHAARTAASQG
jgi:hypothetical protein